MPGDGVSGGILESRFKDNVLRSKLLNGENAEVDPSDRRELGCSGGMSGPK
jgi:hypothetical protein